MPNALWVSETRNMLVAKAASDMTVPAQGRLIAPVVLPSTAMSRFMFVLRPVVATCMIAGLAVIGWAAGVSSSLVSKPGDLFYGLQNAAEQTQLTFAADPPPAPTCILILPTAAPMTWRRLPKGTALIAKATC